MNSHFSNFSSSCISAHSSRLRLRLRLRLRITLTLTLRWSRERQATTSGTNERSDEEGAEFDERGGTQSDSGSVGRQ